MSRIEIGKSPEGRTVYADLDVLIRTRALIQASSGGGKSYLIRRLAEQIFGKVPEFIIDEEGEFPSLRCEKFPFVLVGKGGDTPADPRSAQLLAHRLLEHRASAIFDLSELKPQVRHHWVRLFFEALVESPRALWTPVVVYLDEAHHYAPEKGDSEALGAVVDAATRGRKRGICLIPATQRLAKLSKDVTGELLNRFIGPTFEDLDIERAADLLSIVKTEKADFAKAMRVLAPGNFQLLGRAFGTERIQVKVGPVETTPPEIGRSKEMSAPPPPPEKIKAFLPKLADLPKEAEEKAKTESQLRGEIRSLKAQVASQERLTEAAIKNVRPPAAAAPAAKVKNVEVKVLGAGVLPRLAQMCDQARKSAEYFNAAAKSIESAVHQLADGERAAHFKRVETSARPTIKICAPVPTNPKTQLALGRMAAIAGEQMRETTVSKPQLKILQALAMFEALGISDVPRTWVAPLADTTHKSSGFEKNVSTLKTGGYLEAGSPGNLRIRAEGRGEVGNVYAPSQEQLLAKCKAAVSAPQARILEVLAGHFPAHQSREEIAVEAETSVTSSGFEKNMSTLRTAGMLEVTGKGYARAAAWLFPDHVART